MEPRYGKKGQELTIQGARFRWPEQAVSRTSGRDGASVLYGTPDGTDRLLPPSPRSTRRTVRCVLVWNDAAVELGVLPERRRLRRLGPAEPEARRTRRSCRGRARRLGLEDSQSGVDEPAPPGRPGSSPRAAAHPDDSFSDDLDAMCGWVKHLDGSCVSIQGPPGTGKTYWGAHLVHSLIGAGRRVGITAMSHHAIDNLLEEILEVFEEKGDLSKLKAVRRVPSAPHPRLPGVNYVNQQSPCAKSDYNLVAGTTWLFAGPDMRGAPVDVLIVDEAGQLALADALAASTSAKNIVLLGDPLQLPQVAQAVHPGGGGSSVLRARARGRRDDAAGQRGLPHRDQAHAPRRVPVHLRGDLRGAAREPPGLRPAGHRVRDGASLAPGRPRRLLHRVGRGGGARGDRDRTPARHPVGQPARRSRTR